MSFRDIAEQLHIGLGTAYRMYSRFVRTGEFEPRQRREMPDSRKLDEYHELFIIVLLMENPGLYLVEICRVIYESTALSVSGSTVCRLFIAAS